MFLCPECKKWKPLKLEETQYHENTKEIYIHLKCEDCKSEFRGFLEKQSMGV